MISFRRVIPLLLAGLLAGCTVGPDYHPPQTEIPPRWVSAPAASQTNSPLAEAAWWKSFHDAELDSLVARAAQSASSPTWYEDGFCSAPKNTTYWPEAVIFANSVWSRDK